MGYFESVLAMVLGALLLNYLEDDPIGVVTGESGPTRTTKRRVRMPDVAFFLNEHLPPDAVHWSISKNPPDLAVEIMSPSNTVPEMETKLKEYFKAGAQLVWYIYPPSKTAKLYTSPRKFQEIDAKGFLDGRDLLPGFRVRLGEIFERAERLMKPRAGRKSKKR
jgi:Uma2 family endonuclease